MTQVAENRMPTRVSSAIFWGKASLLKARRAWQDMRSGVKRHPVQPRPTRPASYKILVAESRTPLFTESNPAESALQLGKAQNLRRALRHLNGMRLPANEVFSFWKQVGRATRRRGYVPGRQLREGCLFPAIGGGLCQLSNALYDVALKADCEIVERHLHTHIVPGSAAAQGRDAAIAWNYIDLRFRPATTLLLEATLTQTELILRLHGEGETNRQAEGNRVGALLAAPNNNSASSTDVAPNINSAPNPQSSIGNSKSTIHNLQSTIANRQSSIALLNVSEHSCVTCGVSACFRHDAPDIQALRTQAEAGARVGRVAFLVEERMPELAAYAQTQRDKDALLMLPLDGNRWNKPRYAWETEGYARVVSAALPTLLRAYRARAVGADGPARRQAQLEGAERLAATYAAQLPWDVTHVVVAQSLLPYLWRDGHLGGRTFDALMSRLPLETLQSRLDTAFAAHPKRSLLHDFRAEPELVLWESQALRAARRILTPHADIAALFPRQAERLNWQMPSPLSPAPASRVHGGAIAFPGPTHARKGAHELRAVARALNLEVVLMGSELEGADFWQGVRTRRVVPFAGMDWLDGVGVVAQPAVIEETPRRLLEALARGVPVIATAACGLGDMPGVTTIPVGDEDALCEAMVQRLFSGSPPPLAEKRL